MMFDIMPDAISEEELKEALSKFAIPAEDLKPFCSGNIGYWCYIYDPITKEVTEPGYLQDEEFCRKHNINPEEDRLKFYNYLKLRKNDDGRIISKLEDVVIKIK